MNCCPLSSIQCYMRALFDYEPEEDTLLPCKEIGLPFKYGDILQVSLLFLNNQSTPFESNSFRCSFSR